MKKRKLKIIRDGEVLFQNKLIDIPIKDEFIIKKSVELFDDEDPCIIHQSYVVKEYADSILELFLQADSSVISGKDYINQLEFLDYTNIETLTLELMG